MRFHPALIMSSPRRAVTLEGCLTHYMAGPENTDMMNNRRIGLGSEWVEARPYIFLRDQTENQQGKSYAILYDSFTPKVLGTRSKIQRLQPGERQSDLGQSQLESAGVMPGNQANPKTIC